MAIVLGKIDQFRPILMKLSQLELLGEEIMAGLMLAIIEVEKKEIPIMKDGLTQERLVWIWYLFLLLINGLDAKTAQVKIGTKSIAPILSQVSNGVLFS